MTISQRFRAVQAAVFQRKQVTIFAEQQTAAQGWGSVTSAPGSPVWSGPANVQAISLSAEQIAAGVVPVERTRITIEAPYPAFAVGQYAGLTTPAWRIDSVAPHDSHVDLICSAYTEGSR